MNIFKWIVKKIGAPSELQRISHNPCSCGEYMLTMGGICPFCKSGPVFENNQPKASNADKVFDELWDKYGEHK